jgi:aspartate-semialdehyde dehydrogenase
MGSSKSIHLALLGTESLKGQELRRILETADLPPHKMDMYDTGVESEYSNLSQYRGEAKVIQFPSKESLLQADLLFLAAGDEASLEYGRMAKEKGVTVLDLSLSFNRDPQTPVVVAGVNDQILKREKPALIASPHPASILFSHIFYELRDFGIKQAVAVLLQPVSAFGQKGVDELAEQTLALLDGSKLSKKVFKSQIAFNCLSQTEAVDKSGFSETEKQIVEEVRRIFQDGEFPLTLSLLQVPVFFSFMGMIYFELDKKASIQTLKNTFRDSSYVDVFPSSLSCPASPVVSAGSDKISVSQIKKDPGKQNGFWIWGVTDNLTSGSTLNAVEIARLILETTSR